MSPRRSESDLVRLRRLARESARERSEQLTTIHLLAATWRSGGPARELLEARKLDDAAVLKGARAFDELDDDALEVALSAARDVARRAAVPSRSSFSGSRGTAPGLEPAPGAIHVLVVLLSNRRFAAYRALVQCGVDVSSLRSAATRVALGVVQPPRDRSAPRPVRGRVASRPPIATQPKLERPRTPRGRAVQVPLIPPLRAKQGATPRRRGRALEARQEEARRVEAAKSVVATRPDRQPEARGQASPEHSAEEHSAEEHSAEEHSAEEHSAEEHSAEEHSAEEHSAEEHSAEPSAEPAGLDAERLAMLAELGEDLCTAARAGELAPVVGREMEIERILDVLAKRHANCPLLVGQAGVGKTSVVRGLAQRLAQEGQRTLVEIGIGALVAGTAARGQLAERLASLRAELSQTEGKYLLFIDDIHELIGADEVIAELKVALARGELPMVAATSLDAFRRLIEPEAALARRFTVVEIEEPNEADAFFVLRAVCDDLGRHHAVTFSDEAVASSVSWSIRYLPGRALPDKAVGLLDLAGARLARRGGAQAVAPEHVAEVIAEMAEVPLERLLQTDHERMLNLNELLGARVVGHPDACERIAAVLRRNAAGLRGSRPIGSFMLLGPTGVGKTETAKAIAEALFHAPEAMTRLDMSEYAEPHAVARLIGAPPGYVGHEAGGLLTEAVRRRPYQVVLLDEIEKAHRDVLQAFLQVFDEGRLTDGRGRTVDLRHCVLVMTSNLGADEMRGAMNARPVGFSRSHGCSDANLRDVAVAAARGQLPPELYNRIDEVIFFGPLSQDDVAEIARRLLGGLRDRLAFRGVTLEADDAAVAALLEEGFDPELGARPMRRAIARLVEAPLADMILRGELEDGSVAMLSAADGALTVDSLTPRRAAG